MNRLREEMRIIPRPTWLVAALVYVCMVILLTRATTTGHSAELRNMNFVLKLLFAKGLPIIPAAFFLLAGYVYADARRRGMRYVIWTFLAIFIPNAIGMILYFFFREPLPLDCSSCHSAVRPGFAFCPHCGAALTPACPQCKRSVERGWSNCPHCGSKLFGAPTPATPQGL